MTGQFSARYANPINPSRCTCADDELCHLCAMTEKGDFLPANPTRSDEELRSAAVDVLRRLAANSDARSDLTKRENDAIIAGRGTEDFADEWLALRDEAKELAQESRDLLSALSQTPGGAQKEIRGERTCPDCKGTGVRNANHGMCRSCNGYGKFQDPPPTATAESEPVSESVDSSRGGDWPYGDGPYTEGQLFQALGVDMFLEGQEAAIANAAYVEGYKAGRASVDVKCEAIGCLANPSNPSPPEEGVRLTGALKSLAKPGCDYCKGTGRLIMHERNGAGGGSNVDRVCPCLSNRPVRPLSEGGE